MHDYVRYYNYERIKLGLNRLRPGRIPDEKRCLNSEIITVQPLKVCSKPERFTVQH